MPTRQQILDFIARERAAGQTGPLGKREIARAFAIKGADKIDLKKLLRELEDEGVMERRPRALAKCDPLSQTMLCDVVGRDADGTLIARPAQWDSTANGAPPRIAIAPAKRSHERPPAVGDQALLRLSQNIAPEKGAPLYSGRIIKLLSKKSDRILGVFHARASEGWLEPIDKKLLGRNFSIAEADRGQARDGDLVSVDLLRIRRHGVTAARVRDVVGAMGGEKAISQLALLAHGLPDAFSPEALREAELSRPAPMAAENFQREDWRALPLVTIDPPDAKDHDDAVHACADDAPDNDGGFIVTVAIADVCWYVRPGSMLDRAALERGNSIYFPDRVVPMLPERISNDLCSLRCGEDRPALALRLRLDGDGEKISHSFHRVMMRSAAKLSYAQAQAAFDGAPDAIAAPLMDSALSPLLAAYRCAAKARDRRKPLDLNLPERKILLRPDGRLDRVETPQRLEAHRLIEEFMILANVAAAEILQEKRQGLIYRAHDEPTAEKIKNLSDFLGTIGVKLPRGQKMRSGHFNDILAKAKGSDTEYVVNEFVLRAQAQAEYTAQNYGHFGLNLQKYAHFTSPIRRYADLIVHRALVRALGLGPGGLPDMGLHELEDVASRISAAERRAMAAERETTDRLIADHLSNQVGAQFYARVSGVSKVGLFVRLAETGADGFVPAATLGDEYFRYEQAQAALVGTRSAMVYKIGDEVEVRLVEASPLAGALRFEILSSRANKPRANSGAKRPAKPKFSKQSKKAKPTRKVKKRG